MKIRLAKKLMKYYETPFAFRWRRLRCSTRLSVIKRLNQNNKWIKSGR